jgi:hypothetical protein
MRTARRVPAAAAVIGLLALTFASPAVAGAAGLSEVLRTFNHVGGKDVGRLTAALLHYQFQVAPGTRGQRGSAGGELGGASIRA